MPETPEEFVHGAPALDFPRPADFARRPAGFAGRMSIHPRQPGLCDLARAVQSTRPHPVPESMMQLAKTLPMFALLMLPLTVTAEPGRGGHRGPPPEAIEACADSVERDTCSFSHDGNSVEGVCMPGPRADLPLACRPESPREKPTRRGPPPEAVEACVDLELDEVCWFEHHGNEVEGTCAAGPRDQMPLACKGERRR